MPNINIHLPEELHKQIKLKALMEDKTLQDFFIATLKRRAAQKKQAMQKTLMMQKPPVIKKPRTTQKHTKSA